MFSAGKYFLAGIIIVSFVILALSVPAAVGQDLPTRAAVEDVSLADILAHSAVYCENVKAIALYFVCREQIESVHYNYKERMAEGGRVEGPERTFAKPNRIKFEPHGARLNRYLYDYQLVNTNGALTERWTLIEENGHKRNQDLPSPKDIRFHTSSPLFGPVGFLSRYWQNHFNYEIVGRDRLDDRDTVIVRCEPKIRGADNDNVGRIRVDIRDGSILRIEWEPSSIQGYDDKAPEGYRKGIVCRVDYGVEKNGVRFPSRQVFQESYVDSKDIKTPLEEITFTFLDYKFFTVGVEVKYRP